jgi:hypothetical protein
MEEASVSASDAAKSAKNAEESAKDIQDRVRVVGYFAGIGIAIALISLFVATYKIAQSTLELVAHTTERTSNLEAASKEQAKEIGQLKMILSAQSASNRERPTR